MTSALGSSADSRPVVEADAVSAKARRVLITDPHLRGGGQVRYVTNLARELTAKGHHVTIGCKPESVLIESAREAGCEVLPEFQLRGGLRPRSWQADLARMRRFMAEQQPDIVHVNGSQDHWVAAIANRQAGRPACIVRSRHNTYVVPSHLPNRILNKNLTDYQITVCEFVRRQLENNSAFDPARLRAMHNGVDAEAYGPDDEARAALRAEWGYEDDHLVCGIVARLVEDKGHRFLFEAMGELKDKYTHLRLLVLGEGKQRESLKQLANDLGIAAIANFAGFRTDMARCVHAIDIAVQPSIDCDTSSFSLKELMAAEKPAIASDHGGLPEIVRDGVDGFVVPAGESRPIAEALAKLAEDAALRASMGTSARQRVLDEFTIERFAERTAAAYEAAIAIHHERTAHR